MFQLKWVWKNMKGFRGRFILALFFTVSISFLHLINPTITAKIIDDVVMKLFENKDGIMILKNISQEQFSMLVEVLVSLIIAMALFTLFRSILAYVSIIIYESCSQKFLYVLRADLFEKIQKQDSDFFSKNRTGDIMTRLTGDLDMCRHTIAYVIRCLVDCIFLFFASAIYMFSKNVVLTLVLLAATPILFLATHSFSKKIRPLFVSLREQLSNLNSNAQENIAGNKVVKAFAREEYEIEKFSEKNANFKSANLKTSMTWLNYFPLIEGLSQSLSVSILLVGGIFMINGQISPGDFTAFNSLSWTLIHPMRMLGMLLNDLQRFFASSNKVIELYYAKSEIRNPKNAICPSERIKGEIEFKNVSVKLGNNVVLNDINLEIKAGQTVAIMGSTGAGKTTLINAITRFVDIKNGSLTIDGNEVKKLDLQYLRGGIGIATQDVFLFSETIDGNIAYGDLSLSEDEVKEFAKLASAGFIEKTENGFETLVGERGMGLSGGQKQRIALARALAVRPSILILDDTTSAVDMETEHEIQQNLNNLDFSCTKIIIAQRISSTKNADKIIILDKGRIIEEGTHAELLAKKGYYYDVYALQNGINKSEREVVLNG